MCASCQYLPLIFTISPASVVIEIAERSTDTIEHGSARPGASWRVSGLLTAAPIQVRPRHPLDLRPDDRRVYARRLGHRRDFLRHVGGPNRDDVPVKLGEERPR